jgi:hypothetical protein
MTMLKWETKRGHEQSWDYAARPQCGEPEMHLPITQLPPIESSRVEVPGEEPGEDDPPSAFRLYLSSWAEGQELLFCDPFFMISADAQSEVGIADWDRVMAAIRAFAGARRLRRIAPRKGYRLLGQPVDVRREIEFRERSTERDLADPERRSTAIVEALQRPDLGQDERRKLILEAEVLPFRGQLAAALVPLLRRFIEACRESNVPADLVAVASAIRNYVATAATEEAFEAAASLLKAHGRLPIPLELEVEVTKMVVRKLTVNPPAERGRYPELAARLDELVDAYAKPRFLAREKFGAVALNAVLGLVLTRSGPDQEVVKRMRALEVGWFQQLLARRAASLGSDIAARCVGASLADTVDILEQLSELESADLASHG